MNHTRTRRWAAGAAITTLLAGLLTLVVVAPVQAATTSATLEITPEVTSSAVGTPKTITARLVDKTTGAPASIGAGGTPVPIDFEILGGPADADGGDNRTAPDNTCTILPTFSTCTITVTGGARGTSEVRGWVRETGFLNADLAEKRLSSQLTDCQTEATPTSQSACQSGTEGAGDNTERDQTDVVSVQFTTGPAQLNCEPDTQTVPYQADATVRCTARDSLGSVIQDQRIDGENLDSANDPDSSRAQGGADYDDGCTTGEDGSCTITVKSAPGGSGSRNNQLGTGTLCFWVDSDTDQITDDSFVPTGAPADGGGCGEAVNATENGDTTDVVTVTWAERAPATLDVNPETQLRTLGSTQTLTAAVKDQFGAAWTGGTLVTFAFEAGSPNTGTKSCTTNGTTGTCTVDVTSATAGTDTICASFGAAPSASCDGETVGGGTDTARIDVVQITWFANATTTTTAPTTTTTAPGGGSGDAPQGYSLVGEDGSLYAFGSAKNVGDMKGKPLNAPIIGVAYTPGGNGYWLVAKDGGIFTFGNADFYGSMGDKKLNADVLGMAATPTGKGYWLFAGDGGIFSFGDATFFGSMGDKKLNKPVIQMEPLASGTGYWLVAEDGGIFSFGSAEFHGSRGGEPLNQPIFDMTSTDTDGGYWLIARDGGVFSYGDAGPKFYGNPVNDANPKPTKIIGMDSTPTSKGYWIGDASGKVWNYGDAQALGDRYGAANPKPMIGLAAVPK